MNPQKDNQTQLHDFNPSREHFLDDVLNGLGKRQKELPPKYFYDEQGASLFERICTLDEYYIPRVEAEIMENHIEEIIRVIGRGVLLIEYGSGDCTKTRFLLNHLPDIAAYVPIDISREQLLGVTEQLSSDYPNLEVLPVCADYTGSFELPASRRASNRTLVYFPGSTMGNFDPATARLFLEHVAAVCRPNGGLLIGIDLRKDPAVLHDAYNDDSGVTAAFNLNLLERINRELDGDFRPDQFRHNAFYNQEAGRIEMHLISLRDQTVHLGDATISFVQGESIWTESSYKFDLNEFQQMAAAAGFEVKHTWTDERQWFGVLYLVTS